MAAIQLLVCDMAGTTLHDGDAVLKAFVAALAAEEIRVPPARINAVMGLAKKVAVRELLAELGRGVDERLVDRLHGDFVARMSEFYRTDPGIREIPGAGAAIAAVRKRGVKVALNTGFSRNIVEVILPRLGWTVPETVDAVVASDEVKLGRPHPEMIQTLMDQFGIADSNSVAKVGDTVADLEEGFNAGCRFNIAVLTGALTREEIATLPHTHVLDSIAGLAELLEAAERRID